ncbi:mandelate racemase/muconate lactonizing enzyme family protein [Nocardia xishanensis]|uniref:Mandelate racemase/muconate lactonizing enzyme family protein n=1 Tax=Nocardia xishanensis TaxID=238964 RepID=A0ABW7XBN3_9NOCA
MRITWQTTRLELARPLRISRASMSGRDAAWVRLTDGKDEGWGEVVTSPRLGLDTARITTALAALAARVEECGEPEQFRANLPDLRAAFPLPVVCAVDSAVHDLLARRASVSVAAYLGLAQRDRVPTACTIGLASVAEAGDRTAELTAAGFCVVKIKLGAPDPADDIARVRAVRAVAPSATLLLDPNGAWDASTAVTVLRTLAELDIAAVEQPVPAGRLAWLAEVADRAPIPVIADEDAGAVADLDRLPDGIRGINIKLAECGGLDAALSMIGHARDRGLDVMLGCQAASSLGIAPAVHLLDAARWVDLDGHLLLAEDPWTGLGAADGVLSTPAGPGLGVTTVVAAR